MVVEVLLELCHGRRLPVPLLALVPQQQAGLGRCSSHHGLPDVHVDDFHSIWPSLRSDWFLLLLLVYKEDLRRCQG